MNREYRRESDLPVELESQFILRMPEEPAKLLRELLQTGASLKDRLTIRMENDMRSGEVRVDHWLMHAKIVDLPCIIESLKTIDNKSLYKTADICQMMICKDEPDQPTPEEESPTKKKKDPYKVDKKFLWPHGVAPPAKNVRKRRFRKTLKKKYVEAPEIEKEVKRLLRVDNEAVNVAWEVIADEEDLHLKQEQGMSSGLAGTLGDIKPVKIKSEPHVKSEPDSDQLNQDMSNADVEHDIFGGAVSDSDLDDDDEAVNVELDDTSRLSAYDSRLSDSNSMQGMQLSDSKSMGYPTQFHSEMFSSQQKDEMQGMSGGDNSFTRENISVRILTAREELAELQARKMRTEAEISNMDNLALRNRFLEILKGLDEDIRFREMELRELLGLQKSGRH